MDPGEFTVLLRDWSNGDKAALDSLTPAVYRELRKVAAARLRRERSDHSLQPTELIHEAYMRLVAQPQGQWQNRAQFYYIASQLMRQILVDHARRRLASKRNAGERVNLDDVSPAAPEPDAALLRLDDALKDLAEMDERKSRLIELRYFGGLPGDEIAGVLGISISTLTRESRAAEAWLRAYMADR